MRRGRSRFPGCVNVGVALYATVFACASVQARPVASDERNGWTIEAVVAQDGRLAGCGASTVSAGWRLGLAHSADGSWEMIFSRLERPFVVGEEYEVTLLADSRPIFRGIAEVLPSGIASLSPELSEQAVATLGRSSRLEYATRHGSKALRLAAVGRAIDALRDCVRRNSQESSVAVPAGRRRF